MLPRQNRVLTTAEFRRGFRSPVRTSVDWASFYLVPLEPESPTKVGFVVGGIVGNAVVRNLIRRRLREASRLFIARYPKGFQLTARVRPEVRDFTYAELAGQFAQATDKLLAKVGEVDLRN